MKVRCIDSLQMLAAATGMRDRVLADPEVATNAEFRAAAERLAGFLDRAADVAKSRMVAESAVSLKH